MQLKIEKKAGDSALLAMTKNVSARLEIKMKKSAYVYPETYQSNHSLFQMIYRRRSTVK